MKKLRESHKNDPPPGNKGKISVNKDGVIKYIDKNDFEMYFNNGWKAGMK